MARPLWKGTLGVGLVSIPVEVHTAVRDVGPRFHYLRESDRSRIHYRKVAAKDDKPVDKDDLVKGFEYKKGRYVVLTKEDFERAAVKKDSTIALLDFVISDEVDDRYFDKPYYLLPGKGGERAYTLLRKALEDSGRVGIAKIVMRNKPHLAAVEAIRDALVLSTMRFREELVPLSEYSFPRAKVRSAELRMAKQLVEGLAAEWDPDKYTNEYRANLLQIIEAKQKHRAPKLEAQEAEAEADVVDLMERLRESLGRAPAKRKTKKASRRRTRRTRTEKRAA